MTSSKAIGPYRSQEPSPATEEVVELSVGFELDSAAGKVERVVSVGSSTTRTSHLELPGDPGDENRADDPARNQCTW